MKNNKQYNNYMEINISLQIDTIQRVLHQSFIKNHIKTEDINDNNLKVFSFEIDNLLCKQLDIIEKEEEINKEYIKKWYEYYFGNNCDIK